MTINRKINFNYDSIVDVLYISFDKPRPAISNEINGVLLRYDLQTNKLIGATILDFKYVLYLSKEKYEELFKEIPIDIKIIVDKLRDTAMSIINNMEDLNPDFAKVVDEHFWDLI